MPTSIALRLQVGQYPTRYVAELVNFNLFENEEAHFRCNVRVVGFSTHQWFCAVCKTCGGSARPNTSFPLHEMYICDEGSCTSKAARLRYKISVVATDGTDEAEFVLEGEKGELLICMQISRVITRNQTSRVNSFLAAGSIKYPISEFRSIISNKFNSP